MRPPAIVPVMLALAASSSALQVSVDTVCSRGQGGYPDTVALVNPLGDTVRVDSFQMIRLGSPACMEAGFTSGPPTEYTILSIYGGAQGDTMHTDGYTQGRIAIPPGGSVELSSFMLGSCLLCVSVAATPPYDCIDELLVYASDHTMTSFVVVGPYVSGGTRPAPAPRSARSRAAVQDDGRYNLEGQKVTEGKPGTPSGATAVTESRTH